MGADEAAKAVLGRFHIEVKDDKSVHLGTAGLINAMLQSARDAKLGEVPIVLWRDRARWHLSAWASVMGAPGSIVTISGDLATKQFFLSPSPGYNLPTDQPPGMRDTDVAINGNAARDPCPPG